MKGIARTRLSALAWTWMRKLPVSRIHGTNRSRYSTEDATDALRLMRLGKIQTARPQIRSEIITHGLASAAGRTLFPVFA